MIPESRSIPTLESSVILQERIDYGTCEHWVFYIGLYPFGNLPYIMGFNSIVISYCVPGGLDHMSNSQPYQGAIKITVDCRYGTTMRTDNIFFIFIVVASVNTIHQK